MGNTGCHIKGFIFEVEDGTFWARELHEPFGILEMLICRYTKESVERGEMSVKETK